MSTIERKKRQRDEIGRGSADSNPAGVKQSKFLLYTRSLRALALDPDYERDRQLCVAARAYLHQGNWGACAPLLADSESLSSSTQASLRIQTESIENHENGSIIERIKTSQQYNGPTSIRETYSQCRRRVRELFLDNAITVTDTTT